MNLAKVEEIKNPLTHLDEHGRPRMVDVGDKSVSLRTAEAEGWVSLDEAVCNLMSEGASSKKGDVLRIAETAGIMGAKRTWEIIPLCHPIRLDGVEVQCDFQPEERRIYIRSRIRSKDVTGVEMEALAAVSTAALTVYDMCKAVSKNMIIEGVRLVRKTGGKSGEYLATPASGGRS